jgi:hypothetical protein
MLVAIAATIAVPIIPCSPNLDKNLILNTENSELSTGSLSRLECLAKGSKLLLPKKIMKHYEMTICDKWHDTALISLDLLARLPRTTRFPRITKLLVNNMSEEREGGGLG